MLITLINLGLLILGALLCIKLGYLWCKMDEEVEKAEFRAELWARLKAKIEENNATLEDKAEKETADGN